MHKGSPWVVHSFNSFQPPHTWLSSAKVNAEDWLHCWVRPERYYVALKAINEFHWLYWVFIPWVERSLLGWFGRFFPWLIYIYRCISNTTSLSFVSYYVYVCFFPHSFGFFGWSICSPRKHLRIWWVDIRWPMSRATVTTPFVQCWVQYSHSHLICLFVFGFLVGWLIDD